MSHLVFQDGCEFDHGLIILVQRIFGLRREDGNAIVDIIMQGEGMPLIAEVPADGIEFVLFMQKLESEIFIDDASNLVEEVEAAVVGDDGFGTAE